MMRLKTVTLLRERVKDWNVYPFAVPAIRRLESLKIRSRICFFVGENGSGKSTLLEAIADNYGFGLEGGSRSFYKTTTDSVDRVSPLAKALRVAFSVRAGRGFYLRAESFFNMASQVDETGLQDGYGGRSLHEQSHGESFLSLLESRFQRSGFYVLDEPERRFRHNGNTLTQKPSSTFIPVKKVRQVQCTSARDLTLPNDHHLPSELTQGFRVDGIPEPVSLDLLLPIGAVILGQASAAFAGMKVPEASIDQDALSEAREHNIWSAR